ncbi:MAG: MFS transporter [Clostridiales bacterium]|nr:MFS transporter [Candidatus Equinaster intestinalis]
MKTNYTYTKICCYIGYFVQAIINNFLPLLFVTFNIEYSLSYEKIGSLIVINFVAQIFVDIASVRLVNKFGYHKCTVIANLLAGVGLLMLSFLPRIMESTYIAIIISICFYAVGSGLIEVIISPIIEYLPANKKSSQMSLLHSFYCWGQAVTVLLSVFMFAVIGIKSWFYLPIIWSAVPFCDALLFIKAPIVDPERDMSKRSPKILKSKSFYLYVLVMLCAGASEITVSQWASAFAEQGLHLSKTVGDLLGPTFFALLMGSARLIYGIVGDRFNHQKALMLSSAAAAVCYLGIVFGDTSLAVIFCGLCGFSVGIMWPVTLSMSSRRFKEGGALMFGILAAAGDLGCSAGPFVASIFADKGGLKAGFLAATVFPVIMFSGVLVIFLKDYLARKRKKY